MLVHPTRGDSRWERLNQVSAAIVDAAIRVHSDLGPGLVERVYRIALARRLEAMGFRVETEVWVDFEYDGFVHKRCFRVDLRVEGVLLVELKAVETLHPVHAAQLFTYLKLTGHELGLLLNFNVRKMVDGIERVIRTHRED